MVDAAGEEVCCCFGRGFWGVGGGAEGEDWGGHFGGSWFVQDRGELINSLWLKGDFLVVGDGETRRLSGRRVSHALGIGVPSWGPKVRGSMGTVPRPDRQSPWEGRLAHGDTIFSRLSPWLLGRHKNHVFWASISFLVDGLSYDAFFFSWYGIFPYPDLPIQPGIGTKIGLRLQASLSPQTVTGARIGGEWTVPRLKLYGRTGGLISAWPCQNQPGATDGREQEQSEVGLVNPLLSEERRGKRVPSPTRSGSGPPIIDRGLADARVQDCRDRALPSRHQPPLPGSLPLSPPSQLINLLVTARFAILRAGCSQGFKL